MTQIALLVVSSLNFDLTIPLHDVLELHCSVFVVLRTSSNKRRMGTEALNQGRSFLTFLTQMGRLLEGGAYSSKYGSVFIGRLATE